MYALIKSFFTRKKNQSFPNSSCLFIISLSRPSLFILPFNNYFIYFFLFPNFYVILWEANFMYIRLLEVVPQLTMMCSFTFTPFYLCFILDTFHFFTSVSQIFFLTSLSTVILCFVCLLFNFCLFFFTSRNLVWL